MNIVILRQTDCTMLTIYKLQSAKVNMELEQTTILCL